MFERILLTLDGSELAEAAIAYVQDLAEQLEAEVYLLHVCPPEHQAYLHMHQIYMNSIAEKLRQRIKETARPERESKIQVDIVVGEATRIIFEYVKLKSIGMVVMTSHGTSGIRPISMGNVADRIVRGVGVPTLVIRVGGKKIAEEKKKLIQKILLPLDNSDASKIAIPYAVQLAKKFKASITLFSMAQTVYAQNINGAGMGAGMGAGIGVNWDAIDSASKKYSDEFLQSVQAEIAKEGVNVDYFSNVGLDAAFEILEMEKKTQADLVVMATRGRSNIARWALGSVAEKVLREGDRPILMIKEKAG